MDSWWVVGSKQYWVYPLVSDNRRLQGCPSHLRLQGCPSRLVTHLSHGGVTLLEPIRSQSVVAATLLSTDSQSYCRCWCCSCPLSTWTEASERWTTGFSLSSRTTGLSLLSAQFSVNRMRSFHRIRLFANLQLRTLQWTDCYPENAARRILFRWQ